MLKAIYADIAAYKGLIEAHDKAGVKGAVYDAAVAALAAYEAALQILLAKAQA